jgi:hypothetical protein
VLAGGDGGGRGDAHSAAHHPRLIIEFELTVRGERERTYVSNKYK